MQYQVRYDGRWDRDDTFDRLKILAYVSGFAPSPSDYDSWWVSGAQEYMGEIRQCEEYFLLGEDLFGSPATTVAWETINHVGSWPSETKDMVLAEKDRFGNEVYSLDSEGLTDAAHEYAAEVSFTPDVCDITLFEDFVLENGKSGCVEVHLHFVWKTVSRLTELTPGLVAAGRAPVWREF